MGRWPTVARGGPPVTARYLAVEALARQEQAGYSNLVLDAELRRCRPPLPARESAFATRIFYTVLERRNLLDWVLNRFLRRPVDRLDPPVRAILRAGLAQARYMAVPLPAAVNESVKLARAFGKTSAAGMVNAVLRRAAGFAATPEDFPALQDRLVHYYSLGPAVASLLLQQYGEEAEAMAAAFWVPQPTWVRVNTLRTTDDALTRQLEDEGCHVQPGPWPGCLRVEFPASPASTKAFREGLFHVQGLTSQLAAESVAARPGMKVLDLCAAPGGKTLTMAQAMENTGTLLAGEAVAARLPLLQKALVRCGVQCAQAVLADAAQPNPEFAAAFDRVLCDVPCSGLGVIGKKPDIRYKDISGLEELCALQRRILENGAGMLRPGGRLVYSTCTVNREENEAVVADFLQAHPAVKLVPPPRALPGARDTGAGTLYLPHCSGTDGFFIAVMVKAEGEAALI